MRLVNRVNAASLLAALVCVSSAAATASPLQALLDSDLGRRAEFGRALVESAVAEMSDDYLAAARAGGEASWSAATRAYVAELWRAVDAVAAGAPVRVLRDPDASLRLVVHGNPVRQLALLPARAGERADLEHRVAARVRDRLGDDAALAVASRAAAPAAGEPGGADLATPGGTRTPSSAPRIVGDGLTCETGGARHRRLFERACAQLLGELRALAAHARELLHDGRRVSRDAMAAAIVAPPPRPGQRPLAAPLLARYPEIRADALRWLEAAAAGRPLAVSVAVPARMVYAQPLASLTTR